MATFPRAFFLAVGSALVLFTAGCSEKNPRVAVAGTVTYQKNNLPQGTITFIPKDLTTGTMESAPITDGKYTFAPGKGLLPGSYQVAISAIEGKARPLANEAPGAPRGGKELLPEQYNTRSVLTAEVTGPESKELDFALK
jgi:hypothetical protein